MPAITIAPRHRHARLGPRRARRQTQANATYPAQTLAEELFVIVQDGSASIDVDGEKDCRAGQESGAYPQARRHSSMKAGGPTASLHSRFTPPAVFDPTSPWLGKTPTTSASRFRIKGVRRRSRRGRRRRQRHPMDAAHGCGAGKACTGAAPTHARSCGQNQPLFASIRSRIFACTSTRRINYDDRPRHHRPGCDGPHLRESGAAGHALFLPGGMVHPARPVMSASI